MVEIRLMLPTDMTAFRAQGAEMRRLSPTAVVRQEGDVVEVHELEGVLAGHHETLALRCHEGGVFYYLLLSSFDRIAAGINNSWRHEPERRDMLYVQALDHLQSCYSVREATNLSQPTPQKPKGSHLRVIK